MTLKRNVALTRRTGLKPGKALARGKPLARQRMKRTPPPPGFSDETKAAVRRRSGNRCEAPGPNCTGKATHFHHRKLRRFGDHSDVNCLHVCFVDHERIHANPGKSYLTGEMVRGPLDPAKVPVRALR